MLQNTVMLLTTKNVYFNCHHYCCISCGREVQNHTLSADPTGIPVEDWCKCKQVILFLSPACQGPCGQQLNPPAYQPHPSGQCIQQTCWEYTLTHHPNHKWGCCMGLEQLQMPGVHCWLLASNQTLYHWLPCPSPSYSASFQSTSACSSSPCSNSFCMRILKETILE